MYYNKFIKLLLIYRFFRVVPAKQFLQHFASDRRHMKRPDGSWIKPPPPYTAICTTSEYTIYHKHNDSLEKE